MFLRCKTVSAGFRKSLFGVAIRAFLWRGKGFFMVRKVLFCGAGGWYRHDGYVRDVRRSGFYDGAEGMEVHDQTV